MILLLAGCATAPSDTLRSPIAALARGASSAVVIRTLGEPDKVEAVKANPAAEVWTYHRPIETKIRMVQATMQERIVFDPANRETGMKTVQEPVNHTQRIVVEEVLVLIMVHDQLSDWRRTYREVAETGITR